jgi:hypothetical protein
MLSHQSYVRSWPRHLTMLLRNSIVTAIGKGMGPLEAAGSFRAALLSVLVLSLELSLELLGVQLARMLAPCFGVSMTLALARYLAKLVVEPLLA